MEWSLSCPICGNEKQNDIGECCDNCYWERDIIGENQRDYINNPNNISFNQAKTNYQTHGHIGNLEN